MDKHNDMQRREDMYQIPERLIEEIIERTTNQVLAAMSERDEKIAERAVELTIEQFYKNVGRGVIEKSLVIVGIGVVALLAWLAGSGKIS